MKKRIKDLDLDNKKVIIRVDFNVPFEDGIIKDDTRIRKALKTINYAIDNNAKVILMSHLGRVKTEEDKEKNTLYPVSLKLSELLGKRVIFSKETRGKVLENLINNMNPKDVLLMENTRYEDLDGKKESSCDMELAKYWASLGDLFINDAFGTIHRKHASNFGIASYLDSAIGFLIEEEIKNLSQIKEAKKPLTVIMGGAKVSDKLKLIKGIAEIADYLLIGGAMAFTFLKAKDFNVGASLVEDDMLDECKSLLSKYSSKIVLPVDIRCFKSMDTNNFKVKKISEIEDDDIGLDIGDMTIALFNNVLDNSNTVFWNGPLGVVEKDSSKTGSLEIIKHLSELEDLKIVLGGGDIVAFANNENYANQLGFLSTGGGATLEYLGGEDLESLNIISDV